MTKIKNPAMLDLMDNQNQPVAAPVLPPISQLFRESWQTFTQSILSLFILNIAGIVTYLGLGVLAVLILILSGVGSILLKNGLQNITTSLPSIVADPGFMWFILVVSVVTVVFTVIYIIVGAVLQIASIITVDNQGKTPLGNTLRQGLGLIIPLSLVSILVFFLTFGAFFVFLLPALLFYFLLSFVQFEVILNNQKWTKAINRSVAIVSKHFGAILIRLILLILIYLGYTIITNLLSKIGSDTAVLVGIISFIINLLLGWFSLAYTITLYKQAKTGLEQEKGKGIAWMWIVALIGWLIAIGLGFATYKTISSGVLNNLFKNASSSSFSSGISGNLAAQSSLDLTKEATGKIEEYIKLQGQTNLTSEESKRRTNLLTDALSEYDQATDKDPLNIDAWQSLAIVYQKLGAATPKGSTDQNTLYNQSANAYYNLGKVYLQKNSITQAKKAFEDALQIIPTGNQTLKSEIAKALENL